MRGFWRRDRCSSVRSPDRRYPLVAFRACAPPALATLGVDLAEVRGQMHAKRALEIAAAYDHSVLMLGPPGTGKSMLAARAADSAARAQRRKMHRGRGIHSSRTASIRSDGASGRTARRIIRPRPRRWWAGAARRSPGNLACASWRAVSRRIARVQPRCAGGAARASECGQVTISRAVRSATFPARFQLIAAMNPVPAAFSATRTDAVIARRTRSDATGDGCPGRSSIAST